MGHFIWVNNTSPLARRVYHKDKPDRTAEDIREYDKLKLERTPEELRLCYKLKRELKKRRERRTPDWESAVYAMNTQTLTSLFIKRARRNYNRTHSTTVQLSDLELFDKYPSYESRVEYVVQGGRHRYNHDMLPEVPDFDINEVKHITYSGKKYSITEEWITV